MTILLTTLSKLRYGVLLVLLLACSESNVTGDISQGELMSRLSDHTAPLILDVRSPEEFAQSHVPGAINIPHKNMAAGLAKLNISQADELVVYCESGVRARKAMDYLQSTGFYEVRHLEGDMLAWREAALRVEK